MRSYSVPLRRETSHLSVHAAPPTAIDEDPLTQAILILSSEYGRYGYRRITRLRNAGGSASRDHNAAGGAKD